MKILHWYYDIMNLYGEYGNVKILERHLKDQDIDVIVDKKTLGDEVNLDEYDFVYIGCGTEKNQEAVLEDIKKYKDEIKSYIESDKIFLATGNSYEMFGNLIGKKEGLKIFDFEVERAKDRITSDVIYSSEYFENKIVGFVNKMSNITYNLNHLFKVEFGIGENENKDYEGVKHKNFYGTYISGPLLVRNPEILETFVKKLSSNYKKIEYTNEEEGYKLVLNELLKRMER